MPLRFFTSFPCFLLTMLTLKTCTCLQIQFSGFNTHSTSIKYLYVCAMNVGVFRLLHSQITITKKHSIHSKRYSPPYTYRTENKISQKSIFVYSYQSVIIYYMPCRNDLGNSFEFSRFTRQYANGM